MFNLWRLIFSIYCYIVCLLQSGCRSFPLTALLCDYSTIYLLYHHGHLGDFYTLVIVNNFTMNLLVYVSCYTYTNGMLSMENLLAQQ